MLPKQREMDGIVRQIYEAMEKYEHHSKTLLVLAGDHGMNAGGNHGGSGPGETEPALLFASPRFKRMEKRREYQCPTSPKEGTEFQYYTKIEQSDLVPTLASIMGLPISRNSLGVCIPELGSLWPATGTVPSELTLLLRNAEQLLHIIRAKYGGEAFDRSVEKERQRIREHRYGHIASVSDEQKLIDAWARIIDEVQYRERSVRYDSLLDKVRSFLNLAQNTMSDTASSYDIPRMATGMAISVVALALAVFSFPSFWPPNLAGIFLTLTNLLYGIMMFASSYVEEEQHFWYWLTPVWIALLMFRRLRMSSDARDCLNTAIAGTLVLVIHRHAVRWNQTGQKHAGEPDIVHTFFPQHHVLMWVLILATYIGVIRLLHIRTFTGLLAPELTAIVDVTLFVLAIVFKLNFTQADAPELVEGLALRIREWSGPFSLVLQARAAFAAIAVAAVVVTTLSHRQKAESGSKYGMKGGMISLAERLHYLLTLFLMTQVRAPNIPLIIGLELQRLSLWHLLSDPQSIQREESARTRPPAVLVATSVVLLSHVYYFCMGGSNSISSIDLSNAYNGVGDYNIAAVGVLLFASNWAGPIWWCSAAVLLCTQMSPGAIARELETTDNEREWVMVEREKLHDDAIRLAGPTEAAMEPDSTFTSDSWFVYLACMTSFIATALLAVMAACTALRTHLFIWTVFSPKYLYALAWALGWHLVVNIGMGGLLYRLSSVG
jgi:ethanolaminephosphotransferase